MSEISELAGCHTVFVPAVPARTGAVAFWRPDRGRLPCLPALSSRPSLASAAVEDLPVVRPTDAGVALT
ncbi:hypothetical protein, partial [Streptomyces griseoruber]